MPPPPTPPDLARRVAVAHGLAAHESARSALDYLDRVVIDSRPEPRRFGAVAYPWQRDLARRVAPMVESAAGLRAGYTGPRNFWATLARGHDKTSFVGRLLNWALAFGRSPINMSAAAADADQAGLLREAMEAEARLNPWLGRRLTFGREYTRGPGGNLRILSADAASAFGRRDDLVVCDELTHWSGERGRKGERLFSTLWSGRAKRSSAEGSRSVFVVITNAGVIDSWQWDLFEAAQADPSRWLVFAPAGRLPTWMSPPEVEALRAMLPPAVARRVLDNEWIDPAEASGYLTRPQIEACVDQSLRYTPAAPASPSGQQYYAAIDYGPSRDRTVACVVHREPGLLGRVVVDRLDVWQGSPDAHVPIARVESWVEEVRAGFNQPTLVCDPYELEGTVQRYEHHLKVVRHEPRGGKANYEMAEALRTLVVNRRLAWYPRCGEVVLPDGRGEDLADEMAGLVTRPMSYGYRFDHESGRHDDRSVAVGMAALYCCRDLYPTWVPPANVTPPERRPLKEFDHAGRRGVWGIG